jgi:hypothetical protein
VGLAVADRSPAATNSILTQRFFDMNDIRSLLRIAAKRLELSSFLGRAHGVAIVLAALALVLIAADRAGSTSFVPWTWVVPATVGVGLVIALALWWRRRRDEMQVALAVDERLELRDKLSTALYCDGRQDPFAQAAIEDAVTVARDPRIRERTKRGFGVTAPRGWWVSPLLVLAAFMVSLLNPLDLFSREAEETRESELVRAKQAADGTVEAVVREIRNNPQLNEDLKDMLGELSNDGYDPDALQNPDEIKREAIKKVSEINKRLEDILDGEKGKTADAINETLRQLKAPQDGAAKDLADALSKGDFTAASKALHELTENINNGSMTEQQKQQAAAQLQDIANQLQQLANQQKQLEQALQQAGLDPQLANNPQALQQALQDSPNLNQQQIQQLQQMAQAQQAAAKMCQGLGQACQQMAQAMQQGQPGQMGEGAQQAGQQLSQMEQLQQLLQQAQAAANACQGQAQGLGQGLGMGGRGPGMGNRGQGSGGNAPIAPTPWRTKIVKADVNTDPNGDIIARMLVDGPQYVGESRKTATQVVTEIIEGYDEAQVEEPLPRKYDEANKHFYGELPKLVEARAVEEGETPAPEGEADGDADGEGEGN